MAQATGAKGLYEGALQPATEPGEFDREEPALLKQMVDALLAEGWAVARVADHINATERDVRVLYLGEAAPHLSLVKVDAPPTLFDT